MYRCLIIDDEKLTREGTKEKLRPLSDRIICVGEASNGEEGLQMIQSLRPDLIITDMKMPVLGGERLLPILAERYPDIYIIVISGYQDFEYSKAAIRARAVDYLLKPFSEQDLAQAVNQAIASMENASATENRIKESEAYREALYYAQDLKKLQGLLLGQEEELPAFTSSRLAFIQRSRSLHVLLVHFDASLDETDIQSFLAQQEYGSRCLFLTHSYTASLGFLLIFYPEEAPTKTEELCLSILERLSSYLLVEGRHFFAGISALHHSLTELNTALQESIQALNSKKLSECQLAYAYTPGSLPPNSISWSGEYRLLFCIESGETEEVQELTRELFSYYESLPSISLGDIKYSCLKFATQVRLMLNQYIPWISGDSKETSIQNMLDTMFSIEELSSYYLQFFHTVASALREESVYSDEDIVVNVKTYLEKNYQKDLTVELVASLFHMNRSYLSHIFKKRQGESFKDYLNHIRLTQAKALLRTTDKKIYQIAKGAGYDNVRSLYRAFKKFEHTTPEQYRALTQTNSPPQTL